ncbi:FtsK/SpoIIIE domain-containing protein [Thalassotalea maritima]|uniref:FtsK/SpoIIIE domain-containing protein n=1 Tax=Thalassotalea maritima TaxID=3242416 RepID=UPI00352735A4
MRSLAQYFYAIIKKDYINWKKNNQRDGVPGRLIFKEFDSRLVNEIISNLINLNEFELKPLGSEEGFIIAVENHEHYSSVARQKYDFSELAHERNREGNYYCLMFIAEIKPTLEQVTGIDQSIVFERTELKEWIKIAKDQHKNSIAFLEQYVEGLSKFVFELTNPNWNNRPFIEIDKIDAFIKAVIDSTITDGLFYDALGRNCTHLGGINRLNEFTVLKDANGAYRKVFRSTVSKTLFKDIDWWRAIHRDKEIDIDEIRANIRHIKDSTNDYDDFCNVVKNYFESYFSGDENSAIKYKNELQSNFDSMNPYSSVLQAKSAKPKFKLGESTKSFLIDSDVSVSEEELELLELIDIGKPKPDINELRKFYFNFTKEISINSALDKAWLKQITTSKTTVCRNLIEGLLTVLSKSILINGIDSDIIELKLSKDRTKNSLLRKNWLALQYFNHEYKDLNEFWSLFGDNFKLDLGKPFVKLFDTPPDKKDQKERDGKAANELSFRVLRRSASCEKTIIDSWELKWIFNPHGFESSKYIDFPKVEDRKGFFHKHQLSLDPLFLKRSESTPTIDNVHMFLAVASSLKKGCVVKKLDKEVDLFSKTLDELQAHSYISAQELDNVKGLYASFVEGWINSLKSVLDSPLCSDLTSFGKQLEELIQSILRLNISKEKTGDLLYELLSAHTINVTENKNYSVYLPWSPYSLLMQSQRNSMLIGIADRFRQKRLGVGNKNDGVLAKVLTELFESHGKSFYFQKMRDNNYIDLICTNVNAGYFEYGNISSSKNAIKETEIKSVVNATTTKFLETYPNERHHLQVLCIGLLSYEHILTVYEELLRLIENQEEQLWISLGVTCDDRNALDTIYQTICESFENNKIDSNITIRVVNKLDDIEDGEIDIIYNFDPLFAHNKVASSSPKYNYQELGVFNWEYLASRKVPSDPISKKVLFSLNNHVQDRIGSVFHSAMMHVKGLQPEDSLCREVSNSGLTEEISKGLSKCNWLVIYDYLLNKETLSACQRIDTDNSRRVLRYIQGEGSKRSLAIVTDKETHHITRSLANDIESWSLVHPDQLYALVDKVFNLANSFSGDTLLRSVGNGNFSHDIVGTAGATFLLDKLFEGDEKISPIFWIHLDDYMSWFKSSIEDDVFKSIGQVVNYISDLLGIYISVDQNKKATINILISESKLTRGSDEQSEKSRKQVKSTVELLQSMFYSSENIDFVYWMNKFYEFIIGRFRFSPNQFNFYELISQNKLRINVNVYGISVVFHHNNDTQPTESIELYNKDYLTQLSISSTDTRSIFRAMIDPNFDLDIFESLNFIPLRLNRRKEIGPKDIDIGREVDEAAIINKPGANGVLGSAHSSGEHESEQLSDPDTDCLKPQPESQPAETSAAQNNSLKSALDITQSCVHLLKKNSEEKEHSLDIDQVKGGIREIFSHENLPSVFKECTLTPNSIVVKLQGSVNLIPAKVMKLKDSFLSVVGLSLRQVYPDPGVLVLVFDRKEREKVYFGDLLEASLEERTKTIESDFNNKVLLGLNEFSNKNVFFKLDGASPHALIGGQTKSGKSILMNNMIVDLLMTNSPSHLKLRLFDPKQVEFIAYTKAPHLAHPVVLDKDTAVSRLQELEELMNERYRCLMTLGVRDFEAHNRKYPDNQMSREVVFFDELADWILDKDFKEQAKDIIVKLSSKGRAAGIHLILATQRPSADVVFPLLRANLDTKIALKVDRDQNSEIILGEPGAENLLGYGHGIVKTEGETHFIQVGFTESSVFDDLVDKVIAYWS